MSILIVAATIAEISDFCKRLNFCADINSHHKQYSHNNLTIDVLVTGVGMTATAYYLGKTLADNKYSMVINAGIAGAFNTELHKIGEVLNVKKETFADLGAEDDTSFLSIFDLKLQDSNEFPFNNGYLNNKNSFTEIEYIQRLKNVSGITVNTCHGNETSIQKVKEKYAADVESMEGAAVFYVCLSENIPFLQIRAISNKIERRNRDNWNIPLAIKNLNETLFQIIEQIRKK